MASLCKPFRALYYFPLARCNVRRTWNIHTIANAWKTSPTPSDFTTTALAERTSVMSMSKHLIRPNGKNILWIDLNGLKFGQGEAIHYSVDPHSMDGNPLDDTLKELHKLDMMKHLKQFIDADARKCPSEWIDSVQWDIEHGDEPTKEMWQTLNGLSPRPKHLTLIGGWHEEWSFEPLEALQHQWNDLDTFTLAGISDHDFMENPPVVFSRISSLTLDVCYGLNFIPPNATRLKQVHILENTACEMFIYAVDHNPYFTQLLEVLEIETTNNCDFQCTTNGPQDFRDRLRKCTNLREFQFAAGYRHSLDTDLAAYIPPSVEKLVLRFTRSLPLLQDFEDWIKHASDREWLPHLNSFQLTIDPESSVGGLEGEVVSTWDRRFTRKLENPPREFAPEAFDVEFGEKRDVLYEVLKLTRPSIDLLA